MGGCVGGWLAIRDTFLTGGQRQPAAVRLFGARAPLGAWVAIWGAVAMLTSAPFDDWWHNAYGLDVKIVSPPHTVLGLGMLGISLGALLLVLARQNRNNNAVAGELVLPAEAETDRAGGGLFAYMGGIFLALGAVFTMEFTFPNLQHTALFYKVCALTFPIRLVALGRAGRLSWPATRAAAVFLALDGLMIWTLPLFPAQPKLAPIFNPVTHMVPPPFPVLLIFPALAIDYCLYKARDFRGWWRGVAFSVLLGGVFLGVVIAVQWFFAKFLLSPAADNWFFAGNRYWGYGSGPGEWRSRFWRVDAGRPDADLISLRGLAFTWLLASISSWIGLVWGGWMRKVQR